MMLPNFKYHSELYIEEKIVLWWYYCRYNDLLLISSLLDVEIIRMIIYEIICSVAHRYIIMLICQYTIANIYYNVFYFRAF